MRLDNEKPDYDSVEDRRGQGGGGMGGGFGFPGGGGRRINIPMGGRSGGFSIKTIIFLVIIYFVLKVFLGIDLLQVLNGGGGMSIPGSGTDSQITIPNGNTEVATDSGNDGLGTGQNTTTAGNADAAKEFVARVIGSNNRIWDNIFKNMGQTYQKPKLVLFEDYVQSACGAAQSAMGPFYCPGDQKVYIDLSFYRDMETKLGAAGDFPRAYVIAHEVGHHVQNLFGIADKVTRARMNASEEESNALSVRMELQADCFAGIWTQEADASAKILEAGDIEEALGAAAAIGDDRLQKRSQGYVVPESFTHGTSEQRMNWFQRGYKAKSLQDCDTFATNNL
jgi:predicted metalloprotease